VFKHGFTFKEGMFRGASRMHPKFEHNFIEIKTIKLLEIEQPYYNPNGISPCGEGGNNLR
jgi:hypothetical protein